MKNLKPKDEIDAVIIRLAMLALPKTRVPMSESDWPEFLREHEEAGRKNKKRLTSANVAAALGITPSETAALTRDGLLEVDARGLYTPESVEGAKAVLGGKDDESILGMFQA